MGRVKAFDRHCNMILENVKEMWSEVSDPSWLPLAASCKSCRVQPRLYCPITGLAVSGILIGSGSRP